MQNGEPTNIATVLRDLADLRRKLDELEHHVIGLLRDNGATWEEIGDELGISRQAARQRFEKLRKRYHPR